MIFFWSKNFAFLQNGSSPSFTPTRAMFSRWDWWMKTEVIGKMLGKPLGWGAAGLSTPLYTLCVWVFIGFKGLQQRELNSYGTIPGYHHFYHDYRIISHGRPSCFGRLWNPVVSFLVVVLMGVGNGGAMIMGKMSAPWFFKGFFDCDLLGMLHKKMILLICTYWILNKKTTNVTS